MDYLNRDSFFTGVAEGVIGYDRIIQMLSVVDNELVVEEKGIYSIEKFLISRRIMYWQVYLHKTGLVAENTLVNLLKRAKYLATKNIDLPASKALKHFLYTPITEDNFSNETLNIFSQLDDYDVMLAIKEWVNHDDLVLSSLAKMIIHRNLLKIEIQEEPFKEKYKKEISDKIIKNMGLNKDDLSYFVFSDVIKHQAYNTNKPIKIYTKKGKLKDIAKASDQLNLKALTKPVVKYYLCYPKKMI
ncbi:MAG: phosphohydrolase, partial [Tenacibaculum sp.]